MTVAVDILRQAEVSHPRDVPWQQRLGIHEDRRRLSLLQRAQPLASLSMVRALDSFRPICNMLGSEPNDRDIAQLVETEVSQLRNWLAASGITHNEQDGWFQAAEDGHGIRCTEDGWFTNDVFLCSLHEVWYSRRVQSQEVMVRWRNGVRETETWCNDAVEESAFYCEGSRRYYACSAFDSGQTLDGDTICEAWAELNGYWSDESGCWRNDDPDDDDDGPIPHYHDADRKWSLQAARTSCIAYYGVEVELCFGHENDRLDYYEAFGFPTAELAAERDGSLDEDRGLEVISRPFSLAELRAPWNPLLKALEEAHTYGAASPSPKGYGVHVTTNAQRLTGDHRQRLVDATYDMRALTEFVAGRKSNPEYYSYDKAGRSNEKYTAINERPDGSFEFRVFRGTPDWSLVMSYVEYVDALTEWTRNPANPTQGPLGQALFRAWAKVSGRYPALSSRFTTTVTHEELTCVLPSSSRAA